MSRASAQPPHPYSRREEFLHALLHGLGIAACLAAIPCLILAAGARGDARAVFGGTVFGVTALLVFATSTLYHATSAPSAKRVLRMLDHCAIYLLIAGTYTPFAISVLRGAWGWTLFGVVWALALVGIATKLSIGARFPRLSTLLYVAMGWLGLVAVRPLMAGLTHAAWLWLLAGGVAYTAGVPFYLWKSRQYTHAVWHAAVVAGAACHFVAIVAVVAAPAP